jgi:LDH2 family malate/lactate/ureidoglycolate dehydrogenase
MVFNPKMITDLQTFKANNTEMLQRINESQNIEGQTIRIPGEKSANLEKERTEKDEIEIADEVWKEIQAL